MSMKAARNDDALGACFRAIADADERGASDAVLCRLRDEARSVRRAHVRSLMKMYGVAAALFAAVAIPVAGLAVRRATNASATAPAAVVVADEIATDFYPLFYSTVPASEPRIVRLEIPREALEAAGIEDLAPAVQPVPEMVLADVVVGEDGLARAVRFVQPRGNQQEQQQ
jgi:hypothetical protein